MVKVGSNDEPEDIPGLAHFLEHMLFFGSKKYPKKTEFHDVLSQFGGQTNAYTQDDSTMFYFDIQENGFERALDIFLQFFINPSFEEDTMHKEINAINNEFENDQQNNEWLFFELLRKLAHPQSDFHKFTIGNKKTLEMIPKQKNINVLERLKQFYYSQYSSEKFHVVLIGPQSLEILEQIAVNSFSKIPLRTQPNLINLKHSDRMQQVLKKTQNYSNQNQKKRINAFSDNQLGKFVQYISNGDQKMISIVFPIEQIKKNNLYSNSYNYLEDLIAYKGKGGLYQFLVKKQLISSLKTFQIEKTDDMIIFGVQISPTNEGFDNYIEIVDNFFEYLQFIEKNEINKQLYKDKGLISYLKFMFQERESMANELQDLATTLKNFNPIHFLSAQSLYLNYDERELKDIIQSLKPEKSIIMITSNQFLVSDNQKQNLNQSQKFYQKQQDNQKYFLKLSRNSQIQQLYNYSFKNNYTQILQFNMTPQKNVSNDLKINQLNFQDNPAVQKKLDQYYDMMQLYYSVENINKNLITQFTQIRPANSQKFQAQKSNRFIPNNLDLETNCKQQLNNSISLKQKNKLYVRKRILYKTSYTNLINDLIQQRYDNDQNNKIQISKFCLLKEMIYDSDQDKPLILFNDSHHEIWINKDISYFTPMSYSILLISSKLLKQSAKNFLMLSMISSILGEQIKVEMYDALEMGYIINLDSHRKGIKITIGGFSDQLEHIIEKIFQKLKNEKLDEQIFNLKRVVSMKYLENVKTNQALDQAEEILKYMLLEFSFKAEELLQLMKDLKFKELEIFFQNFFKNIFLQGLFVGNIGNHTAEEIVKKITQILHPEKMQNSSKFHEKVLIVDPKQTYVVRKFNKNPNDRNSAIINYYQLDSDKNLKNNLISSLLINIMKNNAFHYLRTEKQLGYIAQVQQANMENINGVGVTVQGSSKTPFEMDRQIEQFLKIYEDFLSSRLEEEYESAVFNTLQSLSGKDSNLVQKTKRFWNEIDDASYQFNKIEIYGDFFEKIRKADFLGFYEKFFKNEQKKLSVQIQSQFQKSDMNVVLNSNQTYSKQQEILSKDERELKKSLKYK